MLVYDVFTLMVEQGSVSFASASLLPRLTKELHANLSGLIDREGLQRIRCLIYGRIDTFKHLHHADRGVLQGILGIGLDASLDPETIRHQVDSLCHLDGGFACLVEICRHLQTRTCMKLDTPPFPRLFLEEFYAYRTFAERLGHVREFRAFLKQLHGGYGASGAAQTVWLDMGI